MHLTIAAQAIELIPCISGTSLKRLILVPTLVPYELAGHGVTFGKVIVTQVHTGTQLVRGDRAHHAFVVIALLSGFAFFGRANVTGAGEVCSRTTRRYGDHKN